VGIRAVLCVSLLTVCCTQPTSLDALAGPLPEGSGVVLGRVFDSGSNSPVAGATVTARNQDNGFECTNVTAADGTFFIASLPPGLYTIRARREGFQENSISGYPVRLSGTTAAQAAQIGLARTGAGQAPLNANPLPSQPTDLLGTESSFEFLVHWQPAAGAASQNTPALSQPSFLDGFSLIESRQVQGVLPRQRAPELSSDQILVIVTDKQGAQKGWTLIRDPRILRAEGPGPGGELRGQILYRSSADFLVPISGGPASNLKFYQPLWTGKDFSLIFLGTLTLR
jgi:hypothetical protein